MFAFVQAHFTDILAVILATKVTAEVIVNLTPTPVDDGVVAVIYRAIEVVAGIYTAKAKE